MKWPSEAYKRKQILGAREVSGTLLNGRFEGVGNSKQFETTYVLDDSCNVFSKLFA
jgi:hypothetical protein